MTYDENDFIPMKKIDVIALNELYIKQKAKYEDLKEMFEKLIFAFKLNQESLEKNEEIIKQYHESYENLFQAFKMLKEDYEEEIRK